MSRKSFPPAVDVVVLHQTVFRVRCDHPAGGDLLEYGLNCTLHDGPTAEADARVRVAELLALGRTNVRLSKQEHRKVLVAGGRVARDRFVWTDLG